MIPKKAHFSTPEWYVAWPVHTTLPHLVPIGLVQNIKDSIINWKGFHRHGKLELTSQCASEIHMLIWFDAIETDIWQFES